jgi:hypothetical protein
MRQAQPEEERSWIITPNIDILVVETHKWKKLALSFQAGEIPIQGE